MPNVTGGAPNVTGGAPNVTGGTGGVVPNKCGTGKAECNGTCVSIMSDRNNCGACGNVCPQGALCGQGKCNSPKPGDPCGVNGGTLKSHAGVVLSADCRRYYIHNNVWINPSGSGAQTITSDPNVLSGRNFKVTNTTYNSGEWSPGAYPAIYAGCHWKACTAKQAELGLPKQAKDINSVPTTWTYSLKSGGKYNVAYDLWFNKTSVPPTNGNANGAELMIWTNYEGDPRPAGDWSGEVNINSTSWEVWVHPNLCISGSGCWRYITYKAKSKLSNGSMDLAPFVKDAKDSRGLSGDWWLTSIQAGFEIWNSGAGLATTSFATSVK
jgi:hypothetical protein